MKSKAWANCLPFRYRVVWADPVGGEVVREDQDAKVREAHIAQRGERGTDVWAMRERAATAIDDDVCRARQRLRPIFEVVEALGSGSGSMERCAGNVGAVVQSVEANTDDLWLIGRLRIDQLFCQRSGVNALGKGPRRWLVVVAGRSLGGFRRLGCLMSDSGAHERGSRKYRHRRNDADNANYCGGFRNARIRNGHDGSCGRDR